jgi:hypothetical protein
MFAALKKHGLEIGFLCGGNQNNPREHLDFYKQMMMLRPNKMFNDLCTSTTIRARSF